MDVDKDGFIDKNDMECFLKRHEYLEPNRQYSNTTI